MDPYETKAHTVVIVSHFIECTKKKEENKRVISPAVSFTPLYIRGSVTVAKANFQRQRPWLKDSVDQNSWYLMETLLKIGVYSSKNMKYSLQLLTPIRMLELELSYF